MAQVKLVAESFQEFTDNKPVELNEEQLNESLAGKWEKLDKNDEQAVRNFALNIQKDVQGDAGLRVIKNAIAKAKIDSLKQLLDKAAKDGFKGALRPAGNSFVYRPKAERKLASDFKSGGTGGKTGMGGV